MAKIDEVVKFVHVKKQDETHPLSFPDNLNNLDDNWDNSIRPRLRTTEFTNDANATGGIK